MEKLSGVLKKYLRLVKNTTDLNIFYSVFDSGDTNSCRYIQI